MGDGFLGKHGVSQCVEEAVQALVLNRPAARSVPAVAPPVAPPPIAPPASSSSSLDGSAARFLAARLRQAVGVRRSGSDAEDERVDRAARLVRDCSVRSVVFHDNAAEAFFILARSAEPTSSISKALLARFIDAAHVHAPPAPALRGVCLEALDDHALVSFNTFMCTVNVSACFRELTDSLGEAFRELCREEDGVVDVDDALSYLRGMRLPRLAGVRRRSAVDATVNAAGDATGDAPVDAAVAATSSRAAAVAAALPPCAVDAPPPGSLLADAQLALEALVAARSRKGVTEAEFVDVAVNQLSPLGHMSASWMR